MGKDFMVVTFELIVTHRKKGCQGEYGILHNLLILPPK